MRSVISQSGARWRPLSTAAADDEVELQEVETKVRGQKRIPKTAQPDIWHTLTNDPSFNSAS